MRIVFIGTSHWHTRHYFAPVLNEPGTKIVGVSDFDKAATEKWASQAQCPAWTDYREMCAKLRPDFAIALGRHCDMAEIARFLIDQRIPFAMEKPCGTSHAEVTALAAQARQLGVFVSVAFVMRHSQMLDLIRDHAGDEEMLYMSLKFVGRLIERYRAFNVEWMLHRDTAAGGCLLNLGVHCLDLCRLLLRPKEPIVTAATISNALAGLDIEDYASVMLRADRATCHIETGYIYPSEDADSTFDMHLSFRTEKHYFVSRDEHSFEIFDDSKNHEIHKIPTGNVPLYPKFVRESLRRVQHSERPIADLGDMAAVMEMVDAAYTLSPLDLRHKEN